MHPQSVGSPYRWNMSTCSASPDVLTVPSCGGSACHPNGLTSRNLVSSASRRFVREVAVPARQGFKDGDDLPLLRAASPGSLSFARGGRSRSSSAEQFAEPEGGSGRGREAFVGRAKKFASSEFADRISIHGARDRPGPFGAHVVGQLLDADPSTDGVQGPLEAAPIRGRGSPGRRRSIERTLAILTHHRREPRPRPGTNRGISGSRPLCDAHRRHRRRSSADNHVITPFQWSLIPVR